MTKVFVYGTLKRGQPNHRVIEGAEFLSCAVTLGGWSMIDGWFPVVMAGSDGCVAGEVYEVDGPCLAALDRLEGNGRMYQREVVDLELEGGEFTEAWMYVGTPAAWSYRGDRMAPSEAGRLAWPEGKPLEVDEEDAA